MSKREWKLFAEDILESICHVEEYAKGMGLEDFQKDRKTIDAVVRNFEIIGEASKFIPENVKEKYTSVDWKGVLGLRNRIAHDYFTIDTSILWQIVKEEIPKLKAKMKRILEA